MAKTHFKVGVFLTALIAASLAVAAVLCPIDRGNMYFTGRTTVEMGKLLKEYKCPSGHTTWVVN